MDFFGFGSSTNCEYHHPSFEKTLYQNPSKKKNNKIYPKHHLQPICSLSTIQISIDILGMDNFLLG